MRQIAQLLILLVICAPFSVVAGTRIQSTSLTYLGTINVTNSDGACGDTPNARATGLTYNALGNGGAGSFYISGRLNSSGCIAEITKPALGGTATFLQNYTNVTNNTLSQIGDCYLGCYIGGHLVYNNNLYVTAFTYYDSTFDQTKSLWRHSLTLSNHSGMVGPVAAGPDNQGTYNQYMDNVPTEFQAMLGGPAAIGGCCFSVITRTSFGPALYAFDPESPGTVIPLVGYPNGHWTLNDWGAPGSHPEANPTTKMGGVSFVEGTDTVLFVGTTGKGEYCYGPSCYDPANPGVTGTHAYPYVHYMWLYDVDDIAQVKAGTKQMWEVFPYSHFELIDLGQAGDEWSALGVAYVPSEKRLYISLSRTNGSPVPRIHVYSVDDSGGATTILYPPTNLRILN